MHTTGDLYDIHIEGAGDLLVRAMFWTWTSILANCQGLNNISIVFIELNNPIVPAQQICFALFLIA